MENREAYAQNEVILKALTRSNRNGEQHVREILIIKFSLSLYQLSRSLSRYRT